MALMVASVPEFTNRNCSTPGMRSLTSSASSNSPWVGAPNPVPCATVPATARTTAGDAWPRISGPQAQT